MVAGVTIDGIPLSGFTNVSWTLKRGVAPHIENLLTDVFSANEILKRASDINMTEHNFVMLMESGEDIIEISKLLVLGELPGSSILNKIVQLADVRFLWKYKHVMKFFNIRRRSSLTKRIIGEGTDPQVFGVPAPGADDVPVEINQAFADIEYAHWSLKNEVRPWTAAEALASVMDYLSESSTLFQWEIPRTLGNMTPIENLILDEDGQSAVGRILSYIPEANCYVNYEGKVIFYNSLNEAEKGIMEQAGPEMVGQGHTIFNENKIVRPRDIIVLFTPEYEVRYNFVDNDQLSSVPSEDGRGLDNVLSVPDPTLTVKSGNKDQLINQGTWVTIDQAIAAWKLDQPRDIELTKRKIRELWSAFGMSIYWNNILGPAELTTAESGKNLSWTTRIASIRQHYRQTFRVQPKWLNRVRSFKATRLALLDIETGYKAPSLWWGGYAYVLSAEKGIVQYRELSNIAANVDSFTAAAIAKNADEPSLVGARPAPAVVSIVDGDQGIIRVDFRTDPFGHFSQISPSKLGDICSLDLTAQRTKFQFVNQFKKAAGTSAMYLTDRHVGSTIITCVPSSPNGTEQLSGVRVTPESLGFAPGNGPTMEVRIGENVATAMFGWKDEFKEAIEKAFGVVGGAGKGDADDSPPNLSNALINENVLRNISRAVGRQIYKKFVDRQEGTKMVKLLSNVEIDGAVDSIRHAVGADGSPTTAITIVPELQETSLFSQLDSNTRNIVMRLVQKDR